MNNILVGTQKDIESEKKSSCYRMTSRHMGRWSVACQNDPHPRKIVATQIESRVFSKAVVETSLLLMKQQWQHGWVTNYYYHYYLCNHALQRAEYMWMLQMAVLTQTWNLNPLRLSAHLPRTVCPGELQVGLTLWKQCADIRNGALCSKRDTGSDSPAAFANTAAFAGALIIKVICAICSGPWTKKQHQAELN